MLFWREVFLFLEVDYEYWWYTNSKNSNESTQHFDQNVIGAHVSIVIYLRRQGTSVQS